jgi:hypothetical protein
MDNHDNHCSDFSVPEDVKFVNLAENNRSAENFVFVFDVKSFTLYRMEEFFNFNKRVFQLYVVKGVKVYVKGNFSRVFVMKIFRKINFDVLLYREISVSCDDLLLRSERKEMRKSLFSKAPENLKGETFLLDTLLSMIKRQVDKIVSIGKMLKDPHLTPFLSDIASTLLSFTNFQNFNISMLCSSLMRIHSLYVRGKLIFTGESGESFCLALLTTVLPPQFLLIIQRLNLFTSKRILDHPGIIVEVLSLVSEFLCKCAQAVPGVPSCLIRLLEDFMSFGKRSQVVGKMSFYLANWEHSKRVVQNAEWREKVVALKVQIEEDPILLEFVKVNAHAASKFKDFKRMVSALKSYENCSRAEPACIIFQGPPGTQKSILLTQLVSFLKKSSYTHIVKSTDDGKDFYDGYDSQEVFIMDDIGQQGISQWRTIINMVSAVKLPLECAAADLKDSKYFSSSLILATTNQFFDMPALTKSDCISDIKALWRRCHVFDFNSVVNNAGVLSGEIFYRRFDVREGKVVSTFPVGAGLDNIPKSVDVSSRVKTLAWMAMISESLEAFYKKVEIDSKVSVDMDEEILKEYEALKGQSIFEGITSAFDGFLSADYSYDSYLNYLCSLTSFVKFDYFFSLFGEFFKFFSKIILKGLSDFLAGFSAALDLSVSYIGVDMTGVILMGSIVGMTALLLMWVDGEFDKEGKEIFIVNKSELEQWKAAIAKHVGTKEFRIYRGQMVTVNASEESVPTMVTGVKSRMVVVRFPIFKDGVAVGSNTCQALASGHFLVLIGHAAFSHSGIVNVYKDWESYEANNMILNNVPVTTVLDEKSADLVVLKIPQNFVSPFKSAKQYFKPPSVDVSIQPFFVNSGMTANLAATVRVCPENTQYHTVRGVHDLIGNEYLTYPISMPGFCGSMIVDPTIGILGMHVAGNSSEGVAITFSANLRKRIADILSSDGNIAEVNIVPKLNLSGAIAATNLTKTIPSKSNLITSPLIDFAIPTKLPANLSAFGPATVNRMAEKSFVEIPPMDPEMVGFARKCISSFMTKFDQVSEYEVVKGGPGLAPLNKDSVNGWGMEKDKEFYIDFENGCFKPPLLEEIENLENSIRNQTVDIEQVMYYETLKDELRVQGKENKPRSFRVCRLPMIVLTKKYLGNLFRHIVKNRRFNGIMIGINPYLEWDEIYRKLTTAALLLDIDISKYDGGQAAQVQDMVNSVVQEFYIGPNPDILAALLEWVVRTWVLVRNKLMLTTHSMPSGSWVTGLFNSLYNRAYTACCYYRETNKVGKKPTVAEFLTIIDYVCGDDKLCGIPANLTSRVNALTIASLFESVGMEVTDGKKRKIENPGCAINELSFLKRRFVYHTKLKKVMCPLDMETIINSVLYVDKKKETSIVLEGKLHSYQRELFLHEDLYESYVDDMEEHCAKVGVPFTRLTEYYLQHLYTEEADLAYDMYKQDNGKNFDVFMAL